MTEDVDGPDTLSVEAFARYLQLRNLAPSTITAYVRDVGAWLEAGSPPVESWLASLPPCSPSRTICRLAALLNWAKHRKDRRLREELDEVPRPRKRRGLPKPVPDWRERVKRADPVTRAVFVFLVETGLRIDEAHRVNVVLPIPRELRVRGKGDKERMVPLSPLARSALTVLEGQGLAGLSKRTIQSRFRKKLGVTPHQARHERATQIIRQGGTIYDVKALLGHESIATSERYAAYDTRRLHDVVNPQGGSDQAAGGGVQA